jgi:hypothetical protein
MGNRSSKGSSNNKSNMNQEAPLDLTEGNDGNVYALKKRRPGCTGMFWRPDPSGQASLAGNAYWPRDGALLRGTPYKDGKGNQWLIATHVQNKKAAWKKAPLGAAMPFEYDNHYYLEQVTAIASSSSSS